MLARLAIAPVLLAAVLAATSQAAVGDAVALATPVSVKLLDCSPESSSATFHARMRAVEDSERMWMRFTLLVKQGNTFEVLKAPGLGRWHKSKPGVGTFGYRQTVRGLQAGAVYKVQVNFRWYSENRELVEKTQRRSAPCRQFVAVPNLKARIVGSERTKVPGVLRYSVRAANAGVAPATNVALRLSVDGGVVDTVTIAALAPGERRLITFRGPECRSSVMAVADPDGVLVESSETDNVHQLACADLPQR
jgi:hypothetical protein